MWLAVAGDGKIATSKNNGSTWTLAVSGLNSAGAHVPHRCPGTGTIIVPGSVSAFGGISRSVDLGVSWTAIATTATSAFTSVISNGAGRWLAVGPSGTVWRSENDGLAWSNISSNLTSTAPLKHLYGLARSPGGRVLVSAVYGMYHTDNFGDTWAQNTGWSSPTSLTQYSVTYGQSTFVLSSEWIKVYTTPDGSGTPTLRYNSGISSHQLSCAAFNSDKTLFVAVSSRSLGDVTLRLLSTADLSSWTDISTRLPASSSGLGKSIASGPSSVWLVGHSSGKLSRSLDNTATFTDISSGLPFGAQDVNGLLYF